MKLLAKASGIAYLCIFIFGFYANFAILESLVTVNNTEQTVLNIINNSFQFKKGLIGFCIMLLSDVFLIWSLFKITKSIHKTLSYTASFFRGLHASFFLMAFIKLAQVYHITALKTKAIVIQTEVISLLSNFDKLWTIGLLFFSVHLLLLGYIALKTNHIPKIIALLLMVAAFGYFFDGIAKLFLTTYDNYQFFFNAIVICTGVIGELSFTIWLLIIGFSQKTYKL